MTTPSAHARIEGLVGKAGRDPRAGLVLWRMRADDGRVDLTHGDPSQSAHPPMIGDGMPHPSPYGRKRPGR